MIDHPQKSPYPDKIGTYEILHPISSGGMGEIFLARQRGVGDYQKLVVIKKIRPDMHQSHPQLRDMFLDEARLLSRLSHPSIAQVFHFGEENHKLYLVMEYVAGISFAELVRRNPPPLLCARAVAQVCRGLHAAHTLTDLDGNPLHVVHRDVTPDNLMLTYDGQVKVLDFGIALTRGRKAITEFGTIKGKPPYMSPEQLRGSTVDFRADLYAVALVLHELLTGHPVYDGDSIYAIAAAMQDGDVEAPSAKAGQLPPDLDQAVLRGLEQIPTKRFPSALAMAEELERIANRDNGESLQQFAARTLVEPYQQHRAWLAQLLSNFADRRTRRGRATGVQTAQHPSSDPANLPPSTTAPFVRYGRVIIGGVAVAALLAGAVMLVGTTLGPQASSRVSLIPSASTPGDAHVGNRDAAPRRTDGQQSSVVDAAPKQNPTAPPFPSRPPATRTGKTRAAPRGSKKKHPPATAQPQKQAVPAGFVTIAATPYALVRIDGKEIGATPIIRRKIPAGKHTVILVSPDTGQVRLRKIIQVPANGTIRVTP